jgi:hypothetical protein
MVLGFLWLSRLTNLVYDRQLAQLSAAASAIAFLLPSLFITSPIRQRYVLSTAAFDRLLIGILLLGAATIVAGATYNFKFVGIEQIYQFRDKVELPRPLGYLIGMMSTALLPFAFAGFVARKAYWRAAAVLPVLICLYPVTFSKLVLFCSGVARRDIAAFKAGRSQNRRCPVMAGTDCRRGSTDQPVAGKWIAAALFRRRKFSDGSNPVGCDGRLQ